MDEKLSEEVGLLRTLAQNLERVPIPVDPRALAFWREQNIVGLRPDERILPPFELTTRQFVSDLVRDRSRILHGTWSTLNTRVATKRDGLEAVVGAAMRQAVIQLDAYAQEQAPGDDIDAFLAWLERRRTAAKPASAAAAS